MDTIVIPKNWWESKTYQGIIIGTVASVYKILAQRYNWAAWSDDYGDVIVQLLQVLGVVLAGIGLRTASRPIGDPTQPIVTPATPAGTASGEVPVSKGGLE